MHCKYCGSDDHPWFNCRKKPEGWKPPKKIDQIAHHDLPRSSVVEQAERAGDAATAHEVTGSIPVVDASNGVSNKLGRKRDDGPSQGKTPRAAAMRDYMRKWRAKRKAKE